MRAVILAAGMGTRLHGLAGKTPKGLVEVGGTPLLQHSLDALNDHGVRDTVVVVGYLPTAIEARFGARYKDVGIRYVRNAEYETTGSMYSLLQAKSLVGDDAVLVLESDLLYEPRAIRETVDAAYENVLLGAPVSGSGDEVYLVTDGQGRLIDLGKNIPCERRSEAAGELVGISRYSRRFLEAMFTRTEQDYRRGERQCHYEETVLAVQTHDRPVHVVVCDGLTWIEIDKAEDLERAHRDIFPTLQRMAAQTDGRGASAAAGRQ